MALTDRRTFLLGTAAAGLAAAQEQEIRTAYIGAGVRGSELLRLSLAERNVKVAAVCDIDADTRDRALSAAAAHSPQSFTEWRRVVDLKEVDAVFIATPCDLHAEMAAACLGAGKYVYCEKPLGITPEQVALVLRAARGSNAFLQVGQQLRYYRAVREAIRQVHEGVAGKTYIIKAHRHGGRSRSREAETTPQEKTRTTWYADVKHSGDLIVENAVHNIDACNWIAASKPVSAFGHGKKYFPEPIPPGTVMMDGFSVQYIYENDMHCDYSQISFHPRHLKTLPSGMWYTVFGETGTVYMTHTSAHFYDLYGEAEPRDLLAGKGDLEGEDAVAQFVADIRAGRQPFADIRVGAIAALTAIMGREAIYKGRSVDWKELGVEI
ncbi:MAG: Gfo/Idh/MocA family oxidoreductase [Bryobacteraceae bacterium]|nr:Gfo/Idh/MocA family oxidoreductase [Bryobacteraceae bacterium]